ncbi:DNA topoisomerase IV subunit A [Gleimia hominis]|uniref:DNA topoisomerase (ATP-hydrolyzing) n=1 Tax=Gleimia hominis TaxID=595468 RepID=A0ABU3IBI3_9ACTO|nr:DNA topoisomerase IV subunit A [Gleimia hominis]MDT3767741.1 DNA topoisomerase IV subunit A [Gleimia hominis]
MSKTASKASSAPIAEHIVEVNVSSEMRTSFLEYAYSVIYARALPDAKDGCKPVQRRILYQMSQIGLRPDRGHVKSQNVVGEVMGKLHPHGDSAIYDALVRLAQPFNLRLPLVDGHGNFGSLDDGPAAPRYTEVRLAPAALDMVADLDEDVVDQVPNYDNRLMQPEVLPAGFPNLLVNGASGIAVGMATNIAPHNLGEVVAAACHLLENPQASTEDLMHFIPGPDFPEGGIIVGTDGIAQAYETGRGSFRVRAKIDIERVTARKQGLVVTQLPYMVGPERIIERIKDLVNAKRLKGISNVTNLTDRHHGVRLVIEVKTGFNPQAVMAQLYRLTPLEDSFAINAVALVDGKPERLGLKRMLEVYLDHRLSVVRRRSQYRLDRALERLHLVQGLLVAVLDIDDVIAIIRSSETVDEARSRLMVAFDLSEVQADHILSLRLRRLTKFSRLELESERDELEAKIASLREVLGSEVLLRNMVRVELTEVSKRLSTPRRTIVLESEAADPTVAIDTSAPLEIPDEPTRVVLTNRGLVRVSGGEELDLTGARSPFDTFKVQVGSRTRGQVGVVDAAGLLYRVDVMSLPAVARTAQNVSFAAAVDVSRLLGTPVDAVGLVDLDSASVTGFVTRRGIVKRMRPEFAKADTFEVIRLAEGDALVYAAPCPDEADVVMITSDAQLLRTPAAKIRPQGQVSGGVAGMSVSADAQVIAAGFVNMDEAQIVTVATSDAGLLEDAMQSSVKVTPGAVFPTKGRATKGVRAHRFLKSETALCLAGISAGTAIASDENGKAVSLPPVNEHRDGSGVGLDRAIARIS